MLALSPDGTVHLPPVRRVMLFIVLMAGLSAQQLIFSVPPPVIAEMGTAFGATRGPMIAQLFFILPSAGLMIIGVFSGWILEHAGLRRSLIVSLIVFGGMGAVPVVTGSISLLLISRLIMGGACATLATACTMLLVILYFGETRARLLGYQSAFASVTAVISTIISGSVGGLLGWHAPYAIYAFASTAVLVLVFISVQEPTAQRISSKPTRSKKQEEVFIVLKMLMPVYLASALLFMVPTILGAVLPFVLVHRNVTSSVGHALVISSFTVLSAVGAFAFGWLYKRIGARLTFAAGLLLSGVGMIIVGTCPNVALTTIGVGVEGLGAGIFTPHLWTVTATALPDHLRGRAIGFLNTAMFFGVFLTPIVISVLSRSFGMAGVFTAYGVGLLASTVITLVFKQGVLLGSLTLLEVAENG